MRNTRFFTDSPECLLCMAKQAIPLIDDIEKAYTIRTAQEAALQRKIYYMKELFKPICFQKCDLRLAERVFLGRTANFPNVSRMKSASLL